MKKKLYIIGSGPGARELLTERALQVLKSCDRIYSTTHRHKTILSGMAANIEECRIPEIPSVLEASDGVNIGLLVSGDTGFFSVAGSLQQRLEGMADMEIVCGISSLQYFCAKAGISYEDIKTVSLHGRQGSIAGTISYNRKVFVLTGGDNKAHLICKSLMEAGMSHIKAVVGENLSMENERIVRGTVKELAGSTFEDLSVLLLENPDFINCHTPLYDRDFVRGEVPMTKEEIRAVTLSKLAVEPDDVVYDIGAGTGSVAIEMARKAYNGSVFAIEKNDAALGLINRNREKLGAFNVTVVPGTAPGVFAGIPCPNKAFIGGSSGNMDKIVRELRVKNPQVDIVANTISIESLNDAVSTFEKHGLATEIVCINSAVAKKAGNYHMMIANNPVYVISGKSRQ